LDAFASSLEISAADDIEVRAVVAKAVVDRQVTALRGAVALGQAGLGHLGTAFVRQACEEQIWLKYVAQLDPPDADALLLAMGINDNQRGLAAFRRRTSP
jgi:hypothetical protein